MTTASPAVPAPAPRRDEPQARFPAWVVPAILVLAAMLRLREAARAPLWMDEIITLWMARLPLPEMLRAVARDVHPPLHLLLVKGWRALGGEGDFWIKSLAVIFGVTLVAVVWAFARRLFGARAAMLAALLLALHTGAIFVAQESRFYGLLWLWLALAAWAGWSWTERGGRGAALGLVVSAAGAAYTHYLSLVVLAFLGLWGVVALLSAPRRIAAWCGLFAAAALLFAPQVPTLLRQTARDTAEHWTGPPGVAGLVDLLRQISFSAWYIVPIAGVLAILPLARPGQRRAASLLAALIVGPVATCFLLTRAGMHLYTERYMLFTIPFWCMLIAAGLAGLRSTRLRLVTGAVLVLLAARSAIIRPPFEEAAQLARATELLRSHLDPGDVVLSADAHSFFFVEQHLPGRRHLLVWPGPRIPYYEGPLMIPGDHWIDLARLDSVLADLPWWGVRTLHGGTDSRLVTDRFTATSGKPVLELSRVSVWHGGPTPPLIAISDLHPAALRPDPPGVRDPRARR